MQTLDPQFRLQLESVYEALENGEDFFPQTCSRSWYTQANLTG